MPLSNIPPGGDNWIAMVIMCAMSLWGGLINYLTRWKNGVVKSFNWIELAIELSVSSFAGLTIGLMCLSVDVSPLMALAISGVAGHAGGRTVVLLDRWYKRKLTSLDE